MMMMMMMAMMITINSACPFPYTSFHFSILQATLIISYLSVSDRFMILMFRLLQISYTYIFLTYYYFFTLLIIYYYAHNFLSLSGINYYRLYIL